MQLSNAPLKLMLAFAFSGGKNVIPVAPGAPGVANLTEGFPPLTRTPIAAGGIAPSGLDMNGILFEVSAITRWANAGAGYIWDTAFANDANVNGYPKGARVLRTDASGYWLNLTDNNTTDPELGGAGWVPDYTYGVTPIAMTNANVTLTSLQSGKPIIVITGALAANLNLIFPAIVGQWIVINSTTGQFAITAKTPSGTGVPVNAVSSIVGDGTNIYANIDAVSTLTQLTGAAGGTADALTVTLVPAPHSIASLSGVPVYVRAGVANATTTPTININGNVKTIVKGSNSALAIGDIAGLGMWLTLQYDLTLDKVVLLNPATGVSIASNTVGITAGYKNLKINTVGVNNFSSIITADQVELQDGSATPAYITRSAVNLTIVANGTVGNPLSSMQALSANSWRYVWIWYKASLGITATLDTSATLPTTPSGYASTDYKGRFGTVRTDSSGTFYLLNTRQRNNRVQYCVLAGSNTATLPVVQSGAAGSVTIPTYTALPTGSFVPPTAVEIQGVSLAANNITVLLAPNNGYGNNASTTNPPPILQAVPTGGGVQDSRQFDFVLESTDIYFASNGVGLIQCLGWAEG